MRRARRLAPFVLLAAAFALALAVRAHGPSVAVGAGGAASPTALDAFEPVLGLPADPVVVLGAASQENPGETWAYGSLGDVPVEVQGKPYADQLVLLERRETAAGWQVIPLPAGKEGVPPKTGGGLPESLGSLGGRVSPQGALALLTSAGIAVRDPKGAPKLLPAPGAGAAGEAPLADLLGSGESLPPANPPAGAATPFEVTSEADGRAGLLIAPYADGAAAGGSGISGPGVLHYDGRAWTREPISWEGAASEALAPQALACGPASGGATAPSCWLLASYQSESEGRAQSHLALFHRTSEGSGYIWKRQLVSDWLLGSAVPPAGVPQPSGIQTLGARAQTLTVTRQGVWIDFQARLEGAGAPAVEVSELALEPASASSPASVTGHWCFGVSGTPPHGCEYSIEAALPPEYRSFAQPGGSASDPGTRVIAGLPYGAMLELAGAGPFSYELGSGGGGGRFGAALDLSAQGSVGDGVIGEGASAPTDQQGQSQIVDVTSSPKASSLQSSPVPFRRPLLAIAQTPGSGAGPGAPAIAVGADGEIGRYAPGMGWSSEALYNSAGEVQTPTLRAVAWPESERAYAAGDNGAMWLWRADTGLWEPDPATPYNFIGDLTAVAFSPDNPDRGYAVGKQGVLLGYGKTWEQLAGPEQARLEGELKLPLSQLDFSSIAFAGNEALASYRVVVPDRSGQRVEAGGLLAEDGTGWRVDASAASLLASLPDPRDSVISKVAALNDGGAVAAGPGLLIERAGFGAAWRFSATPLPEAQNVSALDAFRDAGGAVRAIVSIDLDPYMNPNYLLAPGEGAFSGDLPPPTGAGQPPPHLPPDPLPDTGYLLEQTASGWSDLEHMTLEAASGIDMPVRPDPVLALQVAGDGGSGLAVGGQTVDTTGTRSNPDFETAAAMHFGPEGASGRADTPAAIATATGAATFAVGGAAACEQPCASFADEGLAPDALLSHALQTANQIAAGSTGGLRGFLYTGDRLLAKSTALGGEVFQRELTRYATLLGSGAPLPVLASASPNDIAPTGGLGPFLSALEPFVPGAGSAYYTFLSNGSSGGPVKVIVLDYSGEALGQTQQAWLGKQLEAAREGHIPAIVMGNASLGFALPEAIGYDPQPVQARDAAEVAKILVEGEASAYLFDYPGVNVQTQIRYGAKHIPAYGTGTLGYASPPGGAQTDSLGSSGFLLLEVDTAAREPGTSNVARVNARVEPNIGELAMDASNGTLLRRSQVGLFEALARIPASGRAVVREGSGEVTLLGPEPYEPIPFNCLGADCAGQIPSDYTFSSSKPDVGDFVAHESGSANPRQVLLSGGKPVADSHSGLFCAYNEGTTVVSVSTGGLSYSMDVTVQGGSSQYPCGTVPLRNPPVRLRPASTGLPLPSLVPSAPAPLTPQIQSLVPPPPLPPARPPATHPHSPPVLPPVPPTPAILFPLLPLLPPPAPNVARPIPPSGTAPVSQQVGVSEEERERQGATEVSHHMVVYRHSEEGPMPTWPLALVPLIVAAAVGLRRGGGSPEPAFARQQRGSRLPC